MSDSVVQQTEISGNTSFVFKNERIGNAKFLRVLGIVEQEPVEVIVATVKGGERIVGRKGNELHSLPAPLNMFGNLLLELPASLGTLLRCPVLHLQPSHLEVEGILTLQHGGFSDWSCHDKYVFNVITAAKVQLFSET